MTTERTQGPWSVVKQFWPEQGESFVVFHSQGNQFSSRASDHLVASCHSCDSAKANAHLIAAAPDLYEALKAIVGLANETVDGAGVRYTFDARSPLAEAARSALQKADRPASESEP